jgi:NAD(P)-dependent dehydrogenase (short-subunit alcohol dehydrogenase family)
MSDLEFKGQVALVTGASRGIGAAIALELAQRGLSVIGTATTDEGAASISDTLAGFVGCGGRTLNVNEAPAVEALIDALLKSHGGLHILVNNAGITRDNLAMRMKDDEWDAVLDTNLTGVWRVGKHATNAMIVAGAKGSIVNIASITAHRTQFMTTAYCVSKAGVDHLTRHMALENARYGIRVNAISPGYYKTAINDEYLDSEAGDAMRKRIAFRRFGEYRELDGALLLLSSEAGSYMTGSTIVVDGGHLLSSL